MAVLEFPRSRVVQVQEMGARLLESRKPKTSLDVLGRALYAGFYDVCLRSGLDRLLADLDAGDRTALGEQPERLAAVVARLEAIELDAGGPRNARPGQLADCVIGGLGLVLVDDAAPTAALVGLARGDVAAVVAAVVDVELAVPRIRESIVATSRALCEPRYHAAFDKIAAQLDERGTRQLKQPNLPLDAVQAVQRALFDGRNAVIDRVGRAAIDRAKAVIAAVDAAAAERIDQPITLTLTPREVALARAREPGVPKTPAAIGAVLVDGLAELARLTWSTPTRAVRTYAPAQAFAVGDLLEHPKFGRGTVTASGLQKIDVEFEDGKHTLIHQLKR
jgi:hypothetical protein